MENLEKKTKEIEFDADLSPYNIHNKEAAKAHNLVYDSKSRVYRDKDSCPVKDRFGQVLG